jgi:serine/threonine protein kinase
LGDILNIFFVFPFLSLQLLHTTCGTPNYVAPEVLNDKGYDGRAADIWSCGVILYVLLAGFLPFDEPHMSQLFRKIQKADFTYPSWFTAPVRALLDRIMVADPLKRLSISDIEQDPWFIGPDNYHDDNDAGVESATVSTGGAGANASSGTLRHVPSEKDVEEAVADVGDDIAVPEAPTAPAPPTLNAFELVNMFGGRALNRLMEAAEKRVLSSPQFLSNFPAEEITSRIASALSSLGAEVTMDDAQFKIKGKVTTGRGQISMTIQVCCFTFAFVF